MSCTHKVIAYNKQVIAIILIANENGDHRSLCFCLKNQIQEL